MQEPIDIQVLDTAMKAWILELTGKDVEWEHDRLAIFVSKYYDGGMYKFVQTMLYSPQVAQPVECECIDGLHHTYSEWQAIGMQVQRGQHGVKIGDGAKMFCKCQVQPIKTVTKGTITKTSL